MIKYMLKNVHFAIVKIGEIMKLKPPVSFQGGKQRLAHKILEIMKARSGSFDGHPFFDLCCGSGAVTIEAINNGEQFSSYTMVDNSVWGDFWESVSNGSFSTKDFHSYVTMMPEKSMIKEFLEKLSKESPYGEPLSHVYKYLLLQAGSFGRKHIWIDGGEWKNTSFCSYWQPTETSSRRYPVNPMMPMPGTIEKRVEGICKKMSGLVSGVKLDVSKTTNFPDHAIIYIDPPYLGTTAYGGNIDVFKWAKDVRKNSYAKIFISESKPMEGKMSWCVSKNRTKGNISGGASGVSEWLIEF